ncbi:MAG: serine/threonine protein kinase, partial [Kofleriaceae bacterium]|nr:serine/threonine protein kinase [Kofleriaceae bacterium]
MLEKFDGTDRYTILSRLGAGGMGVVYEAIDTTNDCRLALKTLSLNDATSIYRFKEEFRGLADVVHPNLVALHELEVAGKQWFFTMELVNGTELLLYLRSENPILSNASTELLVEGIEDSGRDVYREDASLGPEDPSPPSNFSLVRTVMAQLAEGVHALHNAGKLHRDIKPGNVMVSVEGRVVLLDFGLATDYFHRDLLANQIVVGT